MTLLIKVKFACLAIFQQNSPFSRIFKSALYTYLGPIINNAFLSSSLLNVASLNEATLIIPRLLTI
jgi:hypothetical protein